MRFEIENGESGSGRADRGERIGGIWDGGKCLRVGEVSGQDGGRLLLFEVLMTMAKQIWITLMVVIVGLNGLFGGSGMAVLCFHELTEVHLVVGAHEDGVLECSPAGCCQSEGAEEVGNFLKVASCEDGCFDLGLNGGVSEFTLAKGLSKVPSPLVVERSFILGGMVDRIHDERIWRQVVPRGPPGVNGWIERIESTVLRV